jgi:hypothetical protein
LYDAKRMLLLGYLRGPRSRTLLVEASCPTLGLGPWHVVALSLHPVLLRTLVDRSSTPCHTTALLADVDTSHLALEETLPGALVDAVVRVVTAMLRLVGVEVGYIFHKMDKVATIGVEDCA